MTIPDPGQIVTVRQRHFVVVEVNKSTLPRNGFHPSREAPQHLVSLSSVEDDALGEELQVIWEIEPGAKIHEKTTLPEPSDFDDPRRLDAFLDAVRWGAVSSADVRALQSPFRSGIEIEDYQLDPVVRALQMPRVNLPVADDVGLGKTSQIGFTFFLTILNRRHGFPQALYLFTISPFTSPFKWTPFGRRLCQTTVLLCKLLFSFNQLILTASILR